MFFTEPKLTESVIVFPFFGGVSILNKSVICIIIKKTVTPSGTKCSPDTIYPDDVDDRLARFLVVKIRYTGVGKII